MPMGGGPPSSSSPPSPPPPSALPKCMRSTVHDQSGGDSASSGLDVTTARQVGQVGRANHFLAQSAHRGCLHGETRPLVSFQQAGHMPSASFFVHIARHAAFLGGGGKVRTKIRKKKL